MVGLDSQIMLHPQTWVASGHVASFSDPMVEDKKTHKRYRADHLIEAWLEGNPRSEVVVENFTIDQMAQFIKDNKITRQYVSIAKDKYDWVIISQNKRLIRKKIV